MDLRGFNALDQAEWSGGYNPVAPGEYTAFIENSEQRKTQNGEGSYLFLEFKILTPGKFLGKRVIRRLNLENKSEQAQNIARSELAAICRALSMPKPENSQDLHGKPLNIIVQHRRRRVDPTKIDEIVTEYKKEQSQPVKHLPGEGIADSDENNLPF